MVTLDRIKKGLKKQLSQHPFVCLLFSRSLAIYYGLRSLPYRFIRNFNAYIGSTVKITGWSKVKLGLNSVIAAGTWLNVNERDGDDATLCIGKNCFIGRNNFITVGQKVTFGDYCLTGSNCSFVGSSHNIDDPMAPYITTGVDTAAAITIGANCFFGYGVMVIGAVTIGYGSIVGAGAVVLKDIPPFSIVIGNPGRVIKRYSFAAKCWLNIDDYVEEKIISEDEYVRLLHKKVGYYPLPISAASSFLGDI
ncbi:MAG: tetrahydrodipicolinate N-succinyltransferase [Glaciecola sp.]|jgi:acetyltransferase-like isoleucine patch superfamily enzyme